MIAVIFEVEPSAGRRDEYLAIAARLKPMLEHVEGFIARSANSDQEFE